MRSVNSFIETAVALEIGVAMSEKRAHPNTWTQHRLRRSRAAAALIVQVSRQDTWHNLCFTIATGLGSRFHRTEDANGWERDAKYLAASRNVLRDKTERSARRNRRSRGPPKKLNPFAGLTV